MRKKNVRKRKRKESNIVCAKQIEENVEVHLVELAGHTKAYKYGLHHPLLINSDLSGITTNTKGLHHCQQH